MAFKYLFLTRLMFWMKPAWSFRMNAAFESHAEHEYMKLISAHPEWDTEKVDYLNFRNYPPQETLGNLIRRIALDERDHMYHSLEEAERLAE
jgi:ubiquinol oxidase